MKKKTTFKAIYNFCLCLIGLTSCYAQNKNVHPASPFEFRGIYSPTNALDNIRDQYGTHHVDYDWGLWGHNLHKVVGENPDESIVATIDGKKDKECFYKTADILALL